MRAGGAAYDSLGTLKPTRLRAGGAAYDSLGTH
jgi:hypothetical protein